jgi:predicted nucleotidyltransferase
MAARKDKQLIYSKIKDYVQILEQSNIPVWRLYLYGSYAKNTYHAESDIDLAVFWDRDEIDGFDEDVLLRKLRWDIDLRIEPHSFARSDFDETDPYIKDIIETGERIL